MEELMQNGNVPVAMPGKPGSLAVGGGGVVPPVLLDERRVPPFYLEAMALCGAPTPSALPNTAAVYNLMVRSQLPRAVLSCIWSAVNRSLPGQLTRSEFFSCLALMALAQKGESLGALSSTGILPVPVLTPLQPREPSAPRTSHAEGVDVSCPQLPLQPTHSTNHKSTSATSSATDNAVAVEEKRRKDQRERTMTAVVQLVKESMEAIEGRTIDVLREVCRTEAGDSWVASLGRAVRVGERLAASSPSLLPRSRALAASFQRLNQLTIHPHQPPTDSGQARCGVCHSTGAWLPFAGSSYHSECANLWIQRVDSVLPSGEAS